MKRENLFNTSGLVGELVWIHYFLVVKFWEDFVGIPIFVREEFFRNWYGLF